MLVGQQHLGAFALPLHRPADLARRPQHQAMIDVLPALGAEPAAHVAAHHPHLALRHLEHHVGEHVTYAVRIVHVGIQRVAVLCRFVQTDRAARFHVLRVHAGDHVAALHNVRGARERRLGCRPVAAFGGVGDVVGVFIPQTRRVGFRCCRNVRHRGQGFVLHQHQFGGVLRLRQGLGDHHRDGVADITRTVGHHGGPLRREHRRAVALLARHPRLRHRNSVVHEVGAGIDRDHARCGRGRLRIDRADQRVRVRRADEHAPGLPIERLVVLVAALAGEQANILEPADRLADAEFHVGGGFKYVVHVRSLYCGFGVPVIGSPNSTSDLPSKRSSCSDFIG